MIGLIKIQSHELQSHKEQKAIKHIPAITYENERQRTKVHWKEIYHSTYYVRLVRKSSHVPLHMFSTVNFLVWFGATHFLFCFLVTQRNKHKCKLFKPASCKETVPLKRPLWTFLCCHVLEQKGICIFGIDWIVICLV